MKIFLSGNTGFLGSKIESYLSTSNEVFTFSSLSRKRIDLTTEVPILPEVDLVIHSAGKAHVFSSDNNLAKVMYDTNVIGTYNLLSGIPKPQLPKKFVFISSVSVYGLSSGINIDESYPLLATDPYGKSKVEAEKIVKKWCLENDVICTIFRLPLVVGLNPPGNLGNMIRGIVKGYYFNISGGMAKKSMVLASDVSKYLLESSEVGGTFNLTDGYHPQFKELSHLIAKQTSNKFVPSMPLFLARILAIVGDIIGHKFPINSEKLNKITSSLTFDDSKARMAFGWNPTPVLKGFKIHG
jgi:nucleoside-diphosphate-sugar epimerase